MIAGGFGPGRLPALASEHGAEIDSLMGLVHGLMAVLALGWGAFFVYALIRFRRGRNPVASYAGARGRFSVAGEVGVALVEVALLVGFAVPIWAKRVREVPPDRDAFVVRVVAEQFAWNVHYPGADGRFGRTDLKLVVAGTNPLGLDRGDPAGRDDVVLLNQLHLPLGRPVVVHLTSKDVVHGFFLPQMRVKQDAIPGMSIPVWFVPVRMGKWEIACSQLCGVTHYRMRGFYAVHPAAELDSLLKKKAPAPMG